MLHFRRAKQIFHCAKHAKMSCTKRKREESKLKLEALENQIKFLEKI